MFVETEYSLPVFLREAYAMTFPSGLHASCSMPPDGFTGLSYGSFSITSFSLLICSPSNSATKGCGTAVTHSCQCLYIRSSAILPVASGKSAYLSTTLFFNETSAINNIFFSSGENLKSMIPPSRSVICLRLLPSSFITHN